MTLNEVRITSAETRSEVRTITDSLLVSGSDDSSLTAAPDGCLQYFTALSGSIESFNFRDSGSPYPILLDYAICFKRQTGFCGITLTTLTEGDSKYCTEIQVPTMWSWCSFLPLRKCKRRWSGQS